MENFVYVLYNNLSNRYGYVTSYPSDAFALKHVIEETHVDTAEYSLCRVGSINVVTGEVIPESPVRLDWKLDQETLPTKEAK